MSIRNIEIIPLKIIKNEKGNLMHMMKSIDKHFTGFGEIYFSEILPKQKKGFTRRKTATRFYAVISGNAEIILYDNFTNRKIIRIGKKNYCLIKIPPMIWSGFKCIGNEKAIIADFCDKPYDENDVERITIDG